jgi:hypothetical protein
MSAKNALRLVACASLMGASASCNRTPEPAGLEKSAQAATAPAVVTVASTASAATVPATPLSATPVDSSAKTTKAAPSATPGAAATPRSKLERVIVIALENHDADEIYQDPVNAPYIHSLVEHYARTENFEDELPLEVPSEGHYVWMEAGTHHFSDAIFLDDAPPSPSVSTGSSKHLVTQIKNAKGLSWMSYQEGMNEESGACPIADSGFYVPKHNPFVFFRDIAGDPPSKDAAYCAAHHRPYSALEHDLQGELASYVFITPDECHDMHWQRGCPQENPIRTGDRWLKAELPRLIDYADKHDSVIFITFDEGGSTLKLPFLALGSVVKPGYVSREHYTHSSQLKSVELILGLPLLPTVASATDLSDLFKPGTFP